MYRERSFHLKVSNNAESVVSYHDSFLFKTHASFLTVKHKM